MSWPANKQAQTFINRTLALTNIQTNNIYSAMFITTKLVDWGVALGKTLFCDGRSTTLTFFLTF